MSIKKFTLLVWMSLSLAACNLNSPAQAVPSPTVATLPTSTPTPVPSPTATPVPPTPTATPTRSPTQTPTPEYPTQGFGPSGFPNNVNPLTGLFVDDSDVLDRRPLGIKVNIVPRTSTRPPWGLSLADIVYDFYHNDGYSRFHAIYYGNDAELVGPIRSARLPDDPLVRMYKSIFVYGGADPRINIRFLNSNYPDRLILEGRQSLCPPTPDAPLCRHDPNGFSFLLGDTQAIHTFAREEGIDDTRQTLNGMFFKQDPPAGGEAGEEITSRYSGDSYSRWEYDPEEGVYLRLQDDVFDQGQGEEYAPLLDRLDDQQITTANVIVLFAPHSYFQRPPADIVEILFDGGGRAYAFRDGLAYEVQWSRASPDGMITLALEDGTPYPFKPGNTWFQIVGQNSLVSQPEQETWRFEFRIP